jgi:hypothetical protein
MMLSGKGAGNRALFFMVRLGYTLRTQSGERA